MKFCLLVSILAVIVNMVLSIVMPCLLKNTKASFVEDMKKVFNTNRELIIANSIIVGVTTYIAIEIAPFLSESDMMGSMNSMNSMDNYDNFPMNGLGNLGRIYLASRG